MYRRYAQLFEAGHVVFGGIALVAGKAIAGILFFQLEQFAVAGHLGEDGGRRDGRHALIAFDNGFGAAG